MCYGTRHTSWSLRYISSVHTVHRIAKAITERFQKYKLESIPGTLAKCELDTHADTSVVGINFRLIEYTGLSVDVLPYMQTYEPIKDVPIVWAATAWTNPETSQTFILDFFQVLWYGPKMPMSLINPNQLRYNQFIVSDDPTDHDRPFGIQLPHGDILPFDMNGVVVSFDTRVPTDLELDQCKRITMTSDEPWDPSSVTISALQAEIIERQALKQILSLTISNSDTGRSLFEDELLSTISNTLHTIKFLHRVIKSVRIASCFPRQISLLQSDNRHANVTPDQVARILRCGLDTAQRTLKKTTQQNIRHALHPLHRRYRVDHLDLTRRRLNATFFTDTLFSKTKSFNGNTCAQIYTNGYLTRVYPMTAKTGVTIGRTLTEFTEDVGIPDTLVMDLDAAQVGKFTDMQAEIRRLRIKVKYIERGRPSQNHAAEREIGQLKRRWRNRLTSLNIPAALWDYGIVYDAEVLSLLARGSKGTPGLELVTGCTIDISEYLDFTFWDLVWYWDPAIGDDMSDDLRKLGRWLGVAHRVGTPMVYWLLTENCRIIARSTVQHCIPSDQQESKVKERITHFQENIEKIIVQARIESLDPNVFYLEDEPDPEQAHAYWQLPPPDTDYGDMIVTPKPDVDDEVFDNYLNAEILIDRGGDTKVHARVTKRVRDNDGNPVGHRHSNPLLDSRIYECETEDGVLERYTANQIAENIYSQCDDEGLSHVVLKEISDHRSNDTAIRIADGFIISKNGNKVPKRTTKGWELLCEWRDGSNTWIPLKDLKDSNPIEVAEYAVANGLQEEPAFKWWISHVLHNRNRIISKLKSRVRQATHKFGIRVPTSIQEALAIDKETGTTFWWNAIKREVDKIMIAFEIDETITPEDIRSGRAKDKYLGFQEIRCHWIFDVKMDLTRRARFVAGGHTTDTPASLTYSSVVSRDSVRIAFLYAALNDLDILACDIGNAYLNAPCREKIWFVAGPEFGAKVGLPVKIIRALYGLKSSGASWRNTLAITIQDMGYSPTKADPDVWRRRAMKSDGFEYWELLLVYVDDILCISHQPQVSIDFINTVYAVKPDSIGEPKLYLGANIAKYTIPQTQTTYWSMSADDYLKESLKHLRDELALEGRTLTKNKNPFAANYRPELDVTPELDDHYANRFQQLMGVLRWSIELGRLDFYLEVSLLSQHLALPRAGHLEAVYHIFGYIAQQERSRLVFDPSTPDINYAAFSDVDWTDLYGDVQEEVPPDMPEPLGTPVTIYCFVDANHAGNLVTRRSHSGILIFVQNAPILWYSKRQNTVESSTFGSEFVAMRIAKDMIVALRYKLRMFGIPLTGPALVFCDNQGVVKNVSLPQSTLSKKHNAINYHAVREAAAMGVIQVGYEPSETNLADFLTKVVPGDRRRKLVGLFTYYTKA